METQTQQKTLEELRHQRINTLEDLIKLGRVALQEKGVIYLTESRWDGTASYRIFSEEPSLSGDFHADTYGNKKIFIGSLYNQEQRRLTDIAHRMNPKEVLVSLPWMDRSGDSRVVKAVIKEPYFFMG